MSKCSLGGLLVEISVLLGKLEAELESANIYGRGVSKGPRKLLAKSLASVSKLSKYLPRVSKRTNFAKLDEFFFSRAALLPGGKEYWFIDVVSTEGDKTQLVLTFGSSYFKTRVNGQAAQGGKVAAVGWFHSGKKKVFVEKSLFLQSGKGVLKTDAFTLRGAYPSYELVAGKGTAIKFSKPERGVPYEALAASAGTLGFGMFNLYLDASGTIGGKKFVGSAYVQKVVVVAPFIPWNWVRLVFADRSALDFFAVRLDKHDVGRNVLYLATYRFASGRTVKLGDCRLRRLAKDRWLLEGKGVAAYMKTYAFKPFVIKGRGEFHYDEYMVECTDFAFKGVRKQTGIGLIEDAYGLML